MAYKEISGMQIYYYFVCKRKLWYFSNELSMEDGNENVQMGKILDETSYKRANKHIMIDNTINIDFIAEHGMLHEVKKSRKIEEAGIWQLKYYIYYLKSRGVDGLRGRIDYPLLRQSVDIELTEADEDVLKNAIQEIKSIVKSPLPPAKTQNKICKSCAYYEFCVI